MCRRSHCAPWMCTLQVQSGVHLVRVDMTKSHSPASLIHMGKSSEREKSETDVFKCRFRNAHYQSVISVMITQQHQQHRWIKADGWNETVKMDGHSAAQNKQRFLMLPEFQVVSSSHSKREAGKEIWHISAISINNLNEEADQDWQAVLWFCLQLCHTVR